VGHVVKRGKPLRRTRFKRRKPNGTRAKSANLRDAYLKDNPLCEWRCGRRACEVDHIVTKSGDTYESTENYYSSCRKCHDRKHADNLRDEQIERKVAKGEWFVDAESEYNYFGRCYYFDARDI
jgi:5-methylcytosine-specific restriction endonuclease McrA